MAYSRENARFYISPYIVFMALMILYPITDTIILSLMQESDFVSFQNYKQVFQDMYFSRVIFNTSVWTASCVVIVIVINISLGLLLNIDFPGRAIFRMILLVLPWATPDVVAAVAWKWMYNSMYGVLNDLLAHLTGSKHVIDWLGRPNSALLSVIMANIWKGYPIGTMIMIAAYQTIPVEVFEAAQIDGSRGFRTFFRVTVPILRSTMLSLVLISVIWTVNYFPLIHIMTGGGPVHGTDTLVTWAYRESFSLLNFNKGSSIIVIVFIITFAFGMLYIRTVLPDSSRRE